MRGSGGGNEEEKGDNEAGGACFEVDTFLFLFEFLNLHVFRVLVFLNKIKKGPRSYINKSFYHSIILSSI
jgi:hypothetical protein